MAFTLLSRMGDELPIPTAFTHDIDELTYFLENHPAYKACVGILTKQGLNLNDLPRFASTGEIKGYAIPKQFRGLELAVYLHNARKGRPQNANLKMDGRRKAPNWTASTRPNKPRKITDETVRKAFALRGQNVKWKDIAKITKTNLEAIRSAVNTRGPKETTLPCT